MVSPPSGPAGASGAVASGAVGGVVASLGPLLVLTDAAARPGRALAETVAAALAGGARAVVLREKDRPRAERARLVEQLGPLVAGAGAVLLVASDPTIGGDGVHLAAADPFVADPFVAVVAGPSAGASGGTRLVGRSCHSRADVARAAGEGCAYATLSPVFESPSKPGYGPPLGPEALADLPVPTFALGGVDAASVAACRRGGAAGVAVMGAVMRAEDPAVVVRSLLRAWEEAA